MEWIDILHQGDESFVSHERIEKIKIIQAYADKEKFQLNGIKI